MNLYVYFTNSNWAVLRIWSVECVSICHVCSTKNGELQQERSEFESLRRTLQRQLTELQADLEKQRQELSIGAVHISIKLIFTLLSRILSHAQWTESQSFGRNSKHIDTDMYSALFINSLSTEREREREREHGLLNFMTANIVLHHLPFQNLKMRWKRENMNLEHKWMKWMRRCWNMI